MYRSNRVYKGKQMTYSQFKVLFAQLEAKANKMPMVEYYGISIRTLQRWDKEGFKAIRKKKYKFIDGEWIEKKLIYQGKIRLTKKDKYPKLIKKYNKKLKKAFEQC